MVYFNVRLAKNLQESIFSFVHLHKICWSISWWICSEKGVWDYIQETKLLPPYCFCFLFFLSALTRKHIWLIHLLHNSSGSPTNQKRQTPIVKSHKLLLFWTIGIQVCQPKEMNKSKITFHKRWNALIKMMMTNKNKNKNDKWKY